MHPNTSSQTPRIRRPLPTEQQALDGVPLALANSEPGSDCGLGVDVRAGPY